MEFHSFAVARRARTSVRPHRHAEYEFHYLCDGQCGFYRGKDKTDLKDGSFIYFSPGESHHIWFDERDPVGVTHYKFHGRLEPGDADLEALLEERIDGKVAAVGTKRKVFFEQVRRNSDFGNADLKRAVSHSIIAFLYELAAGAGRSTDLNVAPEIETALETIHNSVFATIPPGGLVRASGWSESYFIRSFKALTGLPPRQYLIRLKIDTACTMLTETDLPIREIARQLAFTDEFYFSRTFRKWLGVTPSDYRSGFS